MKYDVCIDAAARTLEPGNFYINDVEAKALIASRPKPEAPVVKRVRADVLLVSIQTFSPSAYAAISSQLRGLALDQRIRNVIIDLRGCGGGVLQDVEETGSLFMNGGLLGYTRGSADTPLRAVVSPGRERSIPAWLAADLQQARLAILVDGKTASGAELFAQGLRLNRSADLMGSRTAGTAANYALQRLTRKDRVLKMWVGTLHDTQDRTWEGIGLEVDVGLVALGGEAPSNGIDGWVTAAMKHLAP
ncbi:S41 family peptidase [Roseateles sp.]|jgi:carboxyl-terminal processing protease|uniref:S41 family peptidase n=1 Tax=Roseateles sp. TaxID=1971397 RepID=UPI0037CC5EDE